MEKNLLDYAVSINNLLILQCIPIKGSFPHSCLWPGSDVQPLWRPLFHSRVIVYVQKADFFLPDHFILIEKYRFSLYPVFAAGVGKSRATDQFTKGDAATLFCVVHEVGAW